MAGGKYTEQMLAMATPEQMAKFRQAAGQRGMTIGEWIRYCCNRAIENARKRRWHAKDTLGRLARAEEKRKAAPVEAIETPTGVVYRKYNRFIKTPENLPCPNCMRESFDGAFCEACGFIQPTKQMSPRKRGPRRKRSGAEKPPPHEAQIEALAAEIKASPTYTNARASYPRPAPPTKPLGGRKSRAVRKQEEESQRETERITVIVEE